MSTLRSMIKRCKSRSYRAALICSSAWIVSLEMPRRMRERPCTDPSCIAVAARNKLLGLRIKLPAGAQPLAIAARPGEDSALERSLSSMPVMEPWRCLLKSARLPFEQRILSLAEPFALDESLDLYDEVRSNASR